jgi:hypothetical protein
MKTTDQKPDSGKMSKRQVIEKYGGPNGNRTRVPDVRGRCPNR